jgi:hypothetical protein
MIGLALLLGAASPAPPFEALPEPDQVLAEQRGGFRLPNGLDIALAVQTQTAVDGAVVLRTLFQVDQGRPSLTVYAPTNGQVVVSTPTSADNGAANGTPTVTFDASNGVQLAPISATVPVTVSTGAVSPVAEAAPAGLDRVASNQPVSTDNGLLTQRLQGGVRTVELTSPGITITHLAGHAFGTAIANSVNNRTIDTQTTVAIDIHNASPDALGSAMLRVQNMALDAAAMRSP